MTDVPGWALERLRGLGGRLSLEAARYRDRWAAAGPRERVAGIAAAAVGAALVGACLFGIWHVFGGWVIRGNWRAGAFGIGLAAVSGALLIAGYLLSRRSGR